MRFGLNSIILLLCVLCVPTALAGSGGVYDGMRVVRVSPVTVSDRLAVAQVPMEFLGEAVRVDGVAEYAADETALALLDAAGVPYEVVIEDLQALVDAGAARRAGRVRYGASVFPRGSDAFFEEFRDLEELYGLCDDLVAAHPDLISRELVGETVEGRPIYGYTISGAGDALEKPTLVFNGTIHAREWISPMTVTYIMRGLVEGYASDDRIRALLDRVTYRIIPVLNPDGYVYSWEEQRFWRKNRRHNGGSSYGVDLNRNFGVAWGGGGSSGSRNSNTYRGPEAFSEPESRALRDYILATPNRVFHIDFHSYSQLVMWPWGYTAEPTPPEDDRALRMLGEQYAADIRAATGANYTPQQSIELYQASGTTEDWSYGEGSVFSFIIELRPRDSQFDPPPSTILPCARENFAGVLTLGETMGHGLMVMPSTLPTIAGVDTGTRVELGVVSSRRGYSLEDASLVLRSRRVGDTAWTESEMEAQGGVFVGTLVAGECGESVEYAVHASWADGQAAAWPGFGDEAVAVGAARIRRFFADSMEAESGWGVGVPDDDAPVGVWERADPAATSVQPEDDRTPDGVYCWVTDNRIGTNYLSYDVDDGKTTLVSPRLDLSGVWGEPTLGFWLWYQTSEDAFEVDISADDGASWEAFARIGESTEGWSWFEYPLGQGYAGSDAVRVRFVARDEGLLPSLVEAAVDDVEIRLVGCEGNPADLAPPERVLDLADIGAFVDAFYAGDPAVDYSEDGVLDLSDIGAFLAFFTSGVP